MRVEQQQALLAWLERYISWMRLLESISCSIRTASHVPVIDSVPVRNGDRVIGELSCGNKLLNIFL